MPFKGNCTQPCVRLQRPTDCKGHRHNHALMPLDSAHNRAMATHGTRTCAQSLHTCMTTMKMRKTTMPPSLNQGRIMVSQLMTMSAMNRPMRPNTAPLTPTTRTQADSKMLLLKFAAKPARISAGFGRVVSTGQSGAVSAGNRLYEQQEACLAKHMSHVHNPAKCQDCCENARQAGPCWTSPFNKAGAAA